MDLEKKYSTQAHTIMFTLTKMMGNIRKEKRCLCLAFVGLKKAFYKKLRKLIWDLSKKKK